MQYGWLQYFHLKDIVLTGTGKQKAISFTGYWQWSVCGAGQQDMTVSFYSYVLCLGLFLQFCYLSSVLCPYKDPVKE